MKSVLFIFGSTGGNTEMVVEFVADLLKQKKYDVKIQRTELSQPKDMLKADMVVLASPTYGHGLLEDHMAKFVRAMKEVDLKGKPCAVIGLGDPKYEAQYHIEAAPDLEKAIKGSGGGLLIPSLRISGSPVMHLKGLIPHWTKQLIEKLKVS